MSVTWSTALVTISKSSGKVGSPACPRVQAFTAAMMPPPSGSITTRPDDEGESSVTLCTRQRKNREIFRNASRRRIRRDGPPPGGLPPLSEGQAGGQEQDVADGAAGRGDGDHRPEV